MIKFENVEIRYGDFVAINDLNLEIKEGEFFTFLGPSGCGKTTSLRALVGFITPSKGKVIVAGKDVTNLPVENRNIGMVFQSYALFPTMTVYENIAFGMKVKKLPKAEIDRKIREVAKKIKITDEQLQKNVSELSGGQQQRVALARAIVLEPKILCLDEPLSNLDAKLRIDMRLELKRLQKELGITTLYVTHDQEEALTLSDSGKDICGIFVEELYQDYVEGTSMENIEARVKCDLDRAGNMENTRYLNDYEKVREHLFLGLLNLEKHRHELKNAVYKTMGDIAITLYVHAGTLKNGITYLKVRSEYLETWGLEKDDVLHDALLNSYRILSPRIYDFKKMMYTPGYAGDDFMNVDPYFISDKKKKEGICLSVKGLTNGAVAVLYPEVIKKLVELMDGDFYVVFSSVHEALIHSSKLCSLEELENLLRTSNSRMTFQKEFLTDKVYYYCREEDKFIMLQGSLKMLVTTIRMDEEN